MAAIDALVGPGFSDRGGFVGGRSLLRNLLLAGGEDE
jgi:hypothetical protein